MRTIKRHALPLNSGKETHLEALCIAYTREKQHWLDELRSGEHQALLGKPRKIRDQFVSSGYQSPHGLQARHWKLALQDAVETWDKYWKATFVQVKAKIAYWVAEEARHYAYWLISGYAQFAELMRGQTPLPYFDIPEKTRDQTACYVRRTVKKCKGKPPTVKKRRSVKCDANCYDVIEHKGRQYLKVMSLKKGQRLVIPLAGKTQIEGTITLVLDKDRVDIHVSQELKPPVHQQQGPPQAIDFGYSEVMTDDQGERYGKQFGKILTKASDARHDKMQKRHQLHAYEKKLRLSNPKKASHSRKYNLGYKKLNRTSRKAKATLEKEINTGINDLLKNRKPSILITEDLRHVFTYNQPKRVNRKLSSWLKGKLQDRVQFKALAEGFRHEQVNPAYGSQSCPQCEFVDHRNRKGDRFKCQHCGHEDQVDRVAAKNYLRRYGDEEIGLHVPYSQVKTILLKRFRRRLETGEPVTVPGRTLETVAEVHPQHLSRQSNYAIAGREYSITGRSIRERNEDKHVFTRF